uniref:Galectin n=1 Tax=Archivesica packardana TaxID=1299447 RepID=A0A514TP85_9BIVA|nr:galectin [Archivesica packardana]
MSHSVQNPGIPYVGTIPNGLQDGMKIHVSGTPEHHHNGFQISLQAGGSINPRSDCAFIFNPRFTENQVVRNSLQSGSWGTEERHGSFPFGRGRYCDVTIHVKPHHYSVSVNGQHYCNYNHRIQKHRVTHISVEQGIRVNSIRFDTVGGGGAGGYPGSSSYPSSDGHPMYNPPVPFIQNVGHMHPSKMIFISGIPHANPSRFSIYLQQGSQHEPHEIAMCFDARFSFGKDRNIVVQNHKQGNWGSEERKVPYFPFQPNNHFEMIILVESYCFKIAVNNQHLVEFNHRIQPLNRTDTLRIDGDVSLTQVRFQG